MSTTSPAVTALRPRSLARRSATLRERVRARRMVGVPHEELLLDVLDGALTRAHRVRPEDHDVWARLVALVEEHPELTHTLPAYAASANLVGLALFGDVEDHAALSGLVDELGHQRLARLQHRYGTALETDSRLPVTSAALRRILAPGIGRRLAAHPRTACRSTTIDDACLRAAHALLLQGVNRRWTVPRLDSVEEFADIAAHGTINEWRHHVAMVIADPWSPYVQRLTDLAHQVGRTHIARVIAAIVELCREQELATGRLAVPLVSHPATRRSRQLDGRAVP
ncbi:hypothetical protein KVF89_28070 [Nocardioides carbamazepini]|uniref:hypothetical protein n=1 Tax=Nocardioides carbamazepini TaxID=2854259 RepID=UPI0021499D1C|nr:hypothetical protein [Nocardioides carbamazepini]MCR1786423.1 hypothetical protein [Nocardioides carbamazepini]